MYRRPSGFAMEKINLGYVWFLIHLTSIHYYVILLFALIKLIFLSPYFNICLMKNYCDFRKEGSLLDVPPQCF